MRMLCTMVCCGPTNVLKQVCGKVSPFTVHAYFCLFFKCKKKKKKKRIHLYLTHEGRHRYMYPEVQSYCSHTPLSRLGVLLNVQTSTPKSFYSKANSEAERSLQQSSEKLLPCAFYVRRIPESIPLLTVVHQQHALEICVKGSPLLQ